MSVSKTEVMQGLVLSKLCRNKKPKSISLIEVDDESAVIEINGAPLYIIYRTKNSYKKATKPKKIKGWKICDVLLTSSHQKYIADHINDANFRLVLVCTTRSLKSTELKKDWKICVLEPVQIKKCLNLHDISDDVRKLQVGWKGVQRVPLRVSGPLNGNCHIDEWIGVSHSYLENWDLPWRG